MINLMVINARGREFDSGWKVKVAAYRKSCWHFRTKFAARSSSLFRQA